jgi:hypothetical protein
LESFPHLGNSEVSDKILDEYEVFFFRQKFTKQN